MVVHPQVPSGGSASSSPGFLVGTMLVGAAVIAVVQAVTATASLVHLAYTGVPFRVWSDLSNAQSTIFSIAFLVAGMSTLAALVHVVAVRPLFGLSLSTPAGRTLRNAGVLLAALALFPLALMTHMVGVPLPTFAHMMVASLTAWSLPIWELGRILERRTAREGVDAGATSMPGAGRASSTLPAEAATGASYRPLATALRGAYLAGVASIVGFVALFALAGLGASALPLVLVVLVVGVGMAIPAFADTATLRSPGPGLGCFIVFVVAMMTVQAFITAHFALRHVIRELS